MNGALAMVVPAMISRSRSLLTPLNERPTTT